MMFSIIDDMDKRERDYSIDFVKGVAILFVILLHNMPNESIYSIAYIGQAVPLFLLVSSYLTYGGFVFSIVPVLVYKEYIKKLYVR